MMRWIPSLLRLPSPILLHLEVPPRFWAVHPQGAGAQAYRTVIVESLAALAIRGAISMAKLVLHNRLI